MKLQFQCNLWWQFFARFVCVHIICMLNGDDVKDAAKRVTIVQYHLPGSHRSNYLCVYETQVFVGCFSK